MSVFSHSFEIEVGTPYALELPKAGKYYIRADDKSVILSVSPHIGGGEAVSYGSYELDINVKGAETLYVIATPTQAGVDTINCIVNDFFVEGGEGSNSNYTFLAPLKNTNGSISLDTANIVSTNQDQTIPSRKRFSKVCVFDGNDGGNWGRVVIASPTSNSANFITWGTFSTTGAFTRTAHLGFSSSTHHDIHLTNEAGGNIIFDGARVKVHRTNSQPLEADDVITKADLDAALAPLLASNAKAKAKK